MKTIFLGLFALILAALTIPRALSAEYLKPVDQFDIIRYSGNWYEIYRLDHIFERGLTNVTATYALRADGKLKVVNRGYDNGSCQLKETAGIGKFSGASDIGDLRVTFFWPFYGAYRIFELDKAGYKWAAVAGPNTNYLWILSRTPKLPSKIEKQLLQKAAVSGFNVDALIKVDHSNGNCKN